MIELEKAMLKVLMDFKDYAPIIHITTNYNEHYIDQNPNLILTIELLTGNKCKLNAKNMISIEQMEFYNFSVLKLVIEEMAEQLRNRLANTQHGLQP